MIPDFMIEEWGGTKVVVDSLVKAGLWERGHESVAFRNWSEYQPTKADVEREREAARERMRNARAKRKGVKVDEQKDAGECSPEQPPNTERTSPEVRETFDNPTLSRPDPVPVPTLIGGSDDPAPNESSIDDDQQNAGTIIAEWIENSNGQRPPGRVIGQLSKEIKVLLDEGHDYQEVRQAVILWSQKALHPSTLASVLHESRNPRTMSANAEQRLSVGYGLMQRAAERTFEPNVFPIKELEQ